jgi:hypothetical protein
MTTTTPLPGERESDIQFRKWEAEAIARGEPAAVKEVAARKAGEAYAVDVRKMTTEEQIAALPWRHELVEMLAQRFTLAFKDRNDATLAFVRKACLRVFNRDVPPAVLVSAWRQAIGGEARHAGKVFVAAWSRESFLERTAE